MSSQSTRSKEPRTYVGSSSYSPNLLDPSSVRSARPLFVGEDVAETFETAFGGKTFWTADRSFQGQSGMMMRETGFLLYEKLEVKVSA